MANLAQQQAAPKALTALQVAARYRQLTDQQCINKLKTQIQALSETHSESAINTYLSSLNGLAAGLANLSNRDQAASLGEILLRPLQVNAPSLMTRMFPDHNKREKVTSMLCTLIHRQVPELSDTDRKTVLDAWRSITKEAKAAYNQQRKSSWGYGGNLSKLPSMDDVRSLIASLPRGDRNRMALMLYTQLAWKEPYRFCSPMLNFGGIRVYTPANYAQAPTEEQMYDEATIYLKHIIAGEQGTPPPQNPGAAGWLLLHPKNQNKDTISLLMFGSRDPDNDKKVQLVIQTYHLNKQLSDEMRIHYLPPRRNQAWLFTDLMHKNVAHSQPLLYRQGRESFNKSLDRYLATSCLNCTVKAVRDSAVTERQRRRQGQDQQSYADELRMGQSEESP